MRPGGAGTAPARHVPEYTVSPMANRPGTVVAMSWSTFTGACSPMKPGITGCIGPLTVEAAIALPMVRDQKAVQIGRTARASVWKAAEVTL